MIHRAALLRHRDAHQPVGKAFRDILLPKTLRPDAAGISLHRDRTGAHVREHHGRDRLVISGDLALGDAVVWKQHLFGVSDHVSRTTSRGALSKQTPTRRGWRSLPCTVHSIKETCTTISGRTQCARSRGRPVAIVKGVLATSSASSRARRSSRSLLSKPVPTFPANT